MLNVFLLSYFKTIDKFKKPFSQQQLLPLPYSSSGAVTHGSPNPIWPRPWGLWISTLRTVEKSDEGRGHLLLTLGPRLKYHIHQECPSFQVCAKDRRQKEGRAAEREPRGTDSPFVKDHRVRALPGLPSAIQHVPRA